MNLKIICEFECKCTVIHSVYMKIRNFHFATLIQRWAIVLTTLKYINLLKNTFIEMLYSAF